MLPAREDELEGARLGAHEQFRIEGQLQPFGQQAPDHLGLVVTALTTPFEMQGDGNYTSARHCSGA